MLGNYYVHPGVPLAPRLPAGMEGVGSIDVGTVASALSVGSLLGFALRVGAGYYLGRFFKHPVAGALLSGFFGVPGLFGLALFAATPAGALPNRKRHRRGGRRGAR